MITYHNGDECLVVINSMYLRVSVATNTYS